MCANCCLSICSAASFHRHSGIVGFQPGYHCLLDFLWKFHAGFFTSRKIFIADLLPCTIWTWTCLLRCRSCRWGFSTTWTKRVAFSGYLGIWFTLNETLLGAGAMVTLPWLRWDSVYGTCWISNRLFAFLQLSFCCCYFVGQQKTLCQLLPTGVLSTPLSCLLAIARGRKLRGLRSWVVSGDFDHWCGRLFP